ncbi:MAG: hypothetical protein AB2A00_08715 [Myxococcota bacterium]
MTVATRALPDERKGRKSTAKELKHLLAYVVLRVLWGVLSRLPEFVVYGLGGLVGKLLCRTKLRRVARENIRLAYGDTPPSPRFPTADALAVGCMQHFGELFAEMLLMDRWQKRIRARLVEEDPNLEPHSRELLKLGKGVVFATGHLANWELLARAVASSGFPFAAMAKAAFDPRVADWLVRWRAGGGVKVLNRGTGESVRGLLERIRSGLGIAVLVDVDTNVHSAWVPFFGRLAKTPTAAADLALRMDAPIVVLWSWRISRGRYGASFTEIPYEKTGNRTADAERITAAITAELERAIRAHPEQWIWSHKRFRSAPPTTVA